MKKNKIVGAGIIALSVIVISALIPTPKRLEKAGQRIFDAGYEDARAGREPRFFENEDVQTVYNQGFIEGDSWYDDERDGETPKRSKEKRDHDERLEEHVGKRMNRSARQNFITGEGGIDDEMLFSGDEDGDEY